MTLVYLQTSKTYVNLEHITKAEVIDDYVTLFLVDGRTATTNGLSEKNTILHLLSVATK